MSRHLVHVSASSDLDRHTLWLLLADSNRWRQWAPRAWVRRPGRNAIDEPGQVRTVVTDDRVTLEQILWVGPRSVVYTVTMGLPVKDLTATVRLVSIPTGTLVDWRADFRPSVPGTGRLLRRRITRMLQEYADALAAVTPKRAGILTSAHRPGAALAA